MLQHALYASLILLICKFQLNFGSFCSSIYTVVHVKIASLISCRSVCRKILWIHWVWGSGYLLRCPALSDLVGKKQNSSNLPYQFGYLLQIRMASIECSIKFRLSCYSSFNAWSGLEALFSLVVELISSNATALIINMKANGGIPEQVIMDLDIAYFRRIPISTESQFSWKFVKVVSIKRKFYYLPWPCFYT